jgi:hypothetical protein
MATEVDVRARLQAALNERGGEYLLHDELEDAGMNRVFVVEDTALERLIAVK